MPHNLKLDPVEFNSFHGRSGLSRGETGYQENLFFENEQESSPELPKTEFKPGEAIFQPDQVGDVAELFGGANADPFATTGESCCSSKGSFTSWLKSSSINQEWLKTGCDDHTKNIQSRGDCRPSHPNKGSCIKPQDPEYLYFDFLLPVEVQLNWLEGKIEWGVAKLDTENENQRNLFIPELDWNWSQPQEAPTHATRSNKNRKVTQAKIPDPKKNPPEFEHYIKGKLIGRDPLGYWREEMEKFNPITCMTDCLTNPEVFITLLIDIGMGSGLPTSTYAMCQIACALGKTFYATLKRIEYLKSIIQCSSKIVSRSTYRKPKVVRMATPPWWFRWAIGVHPPKIVWVIVYKNVCHYTCKCPDGGFVTFSRTFETEGGALLECPHRFIDPDRCP